MISENLRDIGVDFQAWNDAAEAFLDDWGEVPVVLPHTEVEHDFLARRFMLDQECSTSEIQQILAFLDRLDERLCLDRHDRARIDHSHTYGAFRGRECYR